MIYLGNPTASPAVHDAMRSGQIGLIDTPHQGSREAVRDVRAAGAPWCADNGAFSDKWDAEHWWAWLNHDDQLRHVDTCLFAVAPDVVGSASKTEAVARPWLDRIRGLGYPVALVAQNGMQWATWDPWDSIDALFLGGSLECRPCAFIWPKDKKPKRNQPCPKCRRRMTEWKLGAEAVELACIASSLGKWVHLGRVNSEKRWRWADAIGVIDSCDGTYLTFGPDKNLPNLIHWIRSLDRGGQDELFKIGDLV